MDQFPLPPSIYMTFPPRRRRRRRWLRALFGLFGLLALGVVAILGTAAGWMILEDFFLVSPPVMPLETAAAPASPPPTQVPTPAPGPTPTASPAPPLPTPALAAATPAIDPARLQAFLGRLKDGLQSTTARASAPVVDWSPASLPVRKGDIQLRMAWVAVGRVPLKADSMDEPVYSPQAYLGINMELANLGKSRKVEYQTWSGDATGQAPENNARLEDSFGNTYRLILLNPAPLGRTPRASLYPGQRISDMIIFEPPVQGALQLILELPAANFGGEGKIRLMIPTSMIQYAR